MIRNAAREEVENLPWLLTGMAFTWTRWQAWEKWPAVVWEANGQIQGVVLRRLTKKGIALDWIVVEPRHRGVGIGDILLRHVIRDAADRGYPTTMYLRCAADSPAETFWRHWLQDKPFDRSGSDVRFSTEVGEHAKHYRNRVD